jgi:hypothetical protein
LKHCVNWRNQSLPYQSCALAAKAIAIARDEARPMPAQIFYRRYTNERPCCTLASGRGALFLFSQADNLYPWMSSGSRCGGPSPARLIGIAHRPGAGSLWKPSSSSGVPESGSSVRGGTTTVPGGLAGSGFGACEPRCRCMACGIGIVQLGSMSPPDVGSLCALDLGAQFRTGKCRVLVFPHCPQADQRLLNALARAAFLLDADARKRELPPPDPPDLIPEQSAPEKAGSRKTSEVPISFCWREGNIRP